MESPQNIIARSDMSRVQIVGVSICILLNALDGFDVLSISFAAPGIAADWNIDRAVLGFVLAMELIGMAIGSVILGPVADRIGRRPMILMCLIVMTLGMLLAAVAPNLNFLMVARVITGLGIGGMLASISAISAEYANEKNRTLAVSLMTSGYPAGAMVGGFIAAMLLRDYDWRAVFLFGGVVTGLMIPVAWFGIPESIAYLERKRPADALQRINRILERMNHATVSALPELKINKDDIKQSILSSSIVPVLILVTIGYFTHITTYYFIVKWIPKIVVDLGYAASVAGNVLVWTNVGGVIGCLSFGTLSRKFNLKTILIIFLLISSVSVALFGQGGNALNQLTIVAFIAGLFCTGTIVGLYSFIVHFFPTQLRASCTGIVIGFGRGGAILGPIIGGLLLSKEIGLPTVAIIMAIGPLLSAAAFFLVKKSVESTEEMNKSSSV